MEMNQGKIAGGARADVLIGLQLGDEGKGKIVDTIAPNYSAVVRYQGGANSGHTIITGDGNKIVFKTLPSSVMNSNIISMLGNGMVVNPVVMAAELLELGKYRSVTNIRISTRAHLTLPHHIVRDSASEKVLGDKKIGSTMRGNTPTYVDKYNRKGLTFGDVNMKVYGMSKSAMRKEIMKIVIDRCREYPEVSSDDMIRWVYDMVNILDSIPVDKTELTINKMLDKGEPVLLEGAQGHGLDIDWGDYPNVTSSHVTSGGACIGSGVPPSRIGNVIGIMKLYTTRVGAGAFPTEMDVEDGNIIRECGAEYGATTGRPRRIGWLDLEPIRHAIMVSGVNKLVLTKVDILPLLKRPILIYDGEQSVAFPCWGAINAVKDLETIKKNDELMKVKTHLENVLNVPVWMISTGAEKSSIVKLY